MHTTRRLLLVLFSLIPLLTLFHTNDLGRLDYNRNAMAAPDEFSYLLLAKNLLEGHGISTLHTIGRDTFYPPGYPALLALWSALTGGGVTVFKSHILNAVLLTLATWIVYFFSKRLLARLAEEAHPRLRTTPDLNAWLSLLIAALFATNWHVLEGALFIFSEPPFMLTTFAWLALALRWKNWPTNLLQTLTLTLLAIFAWSLRGAGLTCIAAMLLYCLSYLARRPLPQAARANVPARWKALPSLALILLLSLAYQLTLSRISPEKSLANADQSENSYSHQLYNGITLRGELNPRNPHDYPALACRMLFLAGSHLDDFAASFTPWLREPDTYLPLTFIGKSLGLLALTTFLYRLFKKNSPTRFLDLYLLLYVTLYLLWPFNMTRFWAPILPVMLVYAVDALRQFLQSFRPAVPAAALLFLLLALSAQELALQLNNYERRLNYVSDALATSAKVVAQHATDPRDTFIAVAGSSEHFVFAWYLPPPYLPTSPDPRIAPTGHRDNIEQLLIRSLHELDADPHKTLFILSYFTEPSYPDLFIRLRTLVPDLMERCEIRRIYQKEIITTAWEIRLRPPFSTPETAPATQRSSP